MPDEPISLMTAEEVASITVAHDDFEALREIMDRHGTAVVTGVASPAECAELEQEFSEDLRELVDQAAAKRAGNSVSRAASTCVADPHVFPIASVGLLAADARGNERCSGRGLPHGRFAWHARLLPRVRKCYEALHATEDLVVGVDNAFFVPDAAQEAAVNRSWPHCDLNVHDKTADADGVPLGQWDVYQGIVYVWPSDRLRASTTVVWPGSHRQVFDTLMADESAAAKGRKGNHFTTISGLSGPEGEAMREGWRNGARRVPVPAGAMLLWSSRTVHQGWSGGPRLAQPVCWEPRVRRSDAAFERKMRLACLGLPSTHWASLGLPHSLLGGAQLAAPSAASSEKPARGSVRVMLPLRSSIRPVPLVDAAQAAEAEARKAAQATEAEARKRQRKLDELRELEAKQARGEQLQSNQLAKIERLRTLLSASSATPAPSTPSVAPASSAAPPASLEEAWARFGSAAWTQPLPAELREALFASVRPEIAAVL